MQTKSKHRANFLGINRLLWILLICALTPNWNFGQRTTEEKFDTLQGVLFLHPALMPIFIPSHESDSWEKAIDNTTAAFYLGCLEGSLESYYENCQLIEKGGIVRWGRITIVVKHNDFNASLNSQKKQYLLEIRTEIRQKYSFNVYSQTLWVRFNRIEFLEQMQE